MGTTDILMQEHRVIERVLSSLERATNRLNRKEDVYPRFFTGTAAFIKNFTEGCHHKKEEGELFQALVENGVSKESGPLAIILLEHEACRRLSRKMRLATERLQAGDIRARDLVIQIANSYIELFRQHIDKEDNILFPIADIVFPAKVQQRLMESFSQIVIDDKGDDVHEKYFGLAERLEKECLR
jgi:hemerythrin-like domain-containing protein